MDYDRLVAERARIERIMAQIGVIDDKLKFCRSVKAELADQQTSLYATVEDWIGTKRTLLSDVRYTRIVTTDVIEGEMADRLQEYMETVLEDIDDGISDSESLLDKLQAQLGKLQEYEEKLSDERASLAAQL